jgi:hypothetical protein
MTANTFAPSSAAASRAALTAATASVGVIVPKLPGKTRPGASSLTAPMTATLMPLSLKIR